MIKENLFLEHPLRLVRKRLSKIIIAPPTRSLNQRSLTSAITVEHLGTLVQIAISGQPPNKVIVCHLLGELLKAVMLLSNFNEFNSPPYPSEQKFMQKKGFHLGLPSRRKKIPSDSFTFLIYARLVLWFESVQFLMLCLFVCLFLCFVLSFFFFK